jgi:eukaryotic-like serine/threonine-protein kinase
VLDASVVGERAGGWCGETGGKFSIMSQAQSLVGEKLGSFRIESVVGSGAMGVVYRSTNEKNGRVAAVKVVSTEFAQGGKIRDRFDREAAILQQFRHPNIVRFLAVGRFRGTAYLAMEFVEGSTLEKAILERGSLPWLEVVDLGIQVCDALQYAHQNGVVHRDLKPSNLMLTADGKLKLTDFGIAKDLDKTALTGTGRTLGTAAYMAPEQIRGTPSVSHKTDLYALGVVLYQLLVGKPPFEGGTPVVLMHSHLNEPAPRPSARIQEIPKVLDELVVNLMAKSPTDRPWDAAAVGFKLTELREKVDKGGSIAMVWPAQGPGAKSSRATGKGTGGLAADSAVTGDAAGTTARKKKSRRSGTLLRGSGKGRTGGDGASWGLSRSTLETALLVVALFGIGGFIAYWVWPPNSAYLFRHAEMLMASTKRSDWRTARDEYMKELDERFPNHPYQEKLREWCDKILLEDAENRGTNVASGLKINLTKPDNDAERKFIVTNGVAAEASERGDDLAAMAQWQEMADQLKEAATPHKPEDPVERQWYLLALHRVEQLQNAMKDRREYVEKQLLLANAAFRGGRPTEGVTIQSKLVEQFGKYTDLADVFRSAMGARDANRNEETATPGSASPPGEPESTPAPKPAAPAKDSKAEKDSKVGKDSKSEEDQKAEPEPVPDGGSAPPPRSGSTPKDSPPEA